MNRIYIIFLTLLCLTTAFGCKKPTKENTDVTFVNHLSKKVTLDIYSSFNDYAKGTNILLRKTLSGNEKTIIEGSNFKTGATYYMDWYTDDMKSNNWFNDAYPSTGTKVAFSPKVGGNTYYIESGYGGPGRSTFLSLATNSSSWRAVNAYLYSGSTGYVSYWNMIPETEKYHIITVSKDFKALYNHKNGDGTIVTDNIDVNVHNFENAYIEFMDITGNSIGSLMGGKSPLGAPPEYKTSSTDTVMALLPNSDYYFLMIKE